MSFPRTQERVRERGPGQPLVGKAVWTLPPRQEEAQVGFLSLGEACRDWATEDESEGTARGHAPGSKQKEDGCKVGSQARGEEEHEEGQEYS